MGKRSRREFLADVGRGMLVAGVGSTLAVDLGLCALPDDDGPERLQFGEMERLVSLMQQTPVDRLQRVVMEKVGSGTSLPTLVAAAALANARTFGGQDYNGYHTFMALGPALGMAGELPSPASPLPVLKVLYRNTARIQEQGGSSREKLHVVAADETAVPPDPGPWLQAATRSADMDRAERVFASIARAPVGEAYNHLQFAVQDEVDVHRIVLAWRAWTMLDITGPEFAHTLLRQSVRYCVNAEQQMISRGRDPSGIRELLPKLLDTNALHDHAPGETEPGDAWVAESAELICLGSPEEAAKLAAGSLADGISPEVLGEAISLAATRLLLHDRGLSEQQASTGRPAGSVHGASVGVHAADSANAWRNIARVSNRRNTFASLIVGAYHTAGRGGRVQREPIPYEEVARDLSTNDPETLLSSLDEAVRGNDQLRASALVHRFGEQGLSADAIFSRLLPYAVSEDGALHAEKYYRTVQEEFATTRPSLRWQHLVGLARVTASEFGHPAPGQEEARQLLGLG
jgi:hypothetical protein